MGKDSMSPRQYLLTTTQWTVTSPADPDPSQQNMDFSSGPFGSETDDFPIEVELDSDFLVTPALHYKLLWDYDTGVTLKRETILAHPEFARHFKDDGVDEVLRLCESCTCSAHSLLLYLLTGTYQDITGRCLCDRYLERPSDQGFHRTLRANMLAVKYDLHELSTLVKEQLRKEGDQMTFKEILRLLSDIQWTEGNKGEDKDLAELLFERAASIRPGEEDEEIELKDYLGGEEWAYEVMLGSVLKQRAQMQELMRQQSN